MNPSSISKKHYRSWIDDISEIRLGYPKSRPNNALAKKRIEAQKNREIKEFERSLYD